MVPLKWGKRGVGVYGHKGCRGRAGVFGVIRGCKDGTSAWNTYQQKKFVPHPQLLMVDVGSGGASMGWLGRCVEYCILLELKSSGIPQYSVPNVW